MTCVLPVIALLHVLALAADPAAPAVPKEVTVDASVSVGDVVLPSKKNGLKVVQYGYSKAGQEQIHAELQRSLADLSAFRQVTDAPGDYRLKVELVKVTEVLDDYRDVGAIGRKSTYSLRAEARYEWAHGDQVAYSGNTEAASSQQLPPGPIHGSVQEAWKDLLYRLTRLMFVEGLQGGAFGPAPKDSPWIEGGR